MARNKAQCPYGHYYDAGRFELCPVCNSGVLSAAKPAAAHPMNNAAPAPHMAAEQASYTVPLMATGESSRSSSRQTMAMHDDHIENIMASAPHAEMSPFAYQDRFPHYQAPPHVEGQRADIAPAARHMQPKPQSAVAAAGFHSGMEGAMTSAMWNTPTAVEPVVGWLVCVKGVNFGQSFNMKAGNNSIGRAIDMDIYLAQEKSVSRNKHCIITFEPNSQSFFIQQGESRGLTYLNGEMVMAPTKMKANDSIRIGQAEFVFIPLCVDGFRWENHL